jgi:hypothetical protein
MNEQREAASVTTVVQRGSAFVVMGNDGDLGMARVYDSALHRLFPRVPVDEITATDVTILGVASAVPPFSGSWVEPERDVSLDEIASAERVENVP